MQTLSESLHDASSDVNAIFEMNKNIESNTTLIQVQIDYYFETLTILLQLNSIQYQAFLTSYVENKNLEWNVEYQLLVGNDTLIQSNKIPADFSYIELITEGIFRQVMNQLSEDFGFNPSYVYYLPQCPIHHIHDLIDELRSEMNQAN